MPNYLTNIYKLNSFLEGVFAFCRWIYVHFHVNHRHRLLSTNKELSVIPFLVVVILLQIVSNPIENGGYPTIHSVNNIGAKDLSKGVPCFADIRCHTLVWNLRYLVFSQPSCQQLRRPTLTGTQ